MNPAVPTNHWPIFPKFHFESISMWVCTKKNVEKERKKLADREQKQIYKPLRAPRRGFQMSSRHNNLFRWAKSEIQAEHSSSEYFFFQMSLWYQLCLALAMSVINICSDNENNKKVYSYCWHTLNRLRERWSLKHWQEMSHSSTESVPLKRNEQQDKVCEVHVV